LVLSIIYTAQNLYSQDDILQKEVKINSSNCIVEQLLDSLHSNLDVVFVYSDIIKPDRQISITPGKYTLKQVLDSILNFQKFDYLTRDNHIILSPQPLKKVEEEKVVIQGKVMSKKDQPVPFANVYFENTSRGTIANSEGEFRFVIPLKMASDSLTISSIGYEITKIAPADYLNKNLEVHLKTIFIAIKDIVVHPINPNDIILQSYQNRIHNYSSKDVFLTAFFREASKQDDDYISLSEALVEVDKKAYLSSSDDLIQLIKGRNGKNINHSDLVNLVVQGGLYNGIRLDVAKYGGFFYTSDACREYDYKLVKTIVFKGRSTYLISFDMKDNLDYAGFKGDLYIDVESLALVRAEFELSPKGLKYAKESLVKRTPKGFTAKPIFARYEVEYRYYNNIWNLYYAHSEINIKVKQRGREDAKNFSCNFSSTSEFVITGINDNPDARIRLRDASKPNDVLYEQVQNTGNTYWTDNNIILPEEPLQTTIEKLQSEGVIPADKSSIKSN
jgi:hypothetical protein